MKYYEISRKNVKNVTEGIKKGLYNVWDDDRIKKAFNCGNGSIKDFENYMKDNKNNCYFKKIS